MSNEQITNRLISMQSQIDGGRLIKGRLREDEWPTFINATAALSELPIFLDDIPGQSVMQIRAKAHRLKAEYGLDLMIIDYLQLMAAPQVKGYSNRVQELSQMTKALKTLSRELDIPILVGSQLSRKVEGREDKRPMISDTRDSGTIEEDADIVILIYRDVYYDPQTENPNIAELDAAKRRNGKAGMAPAFFKAETTQFISVDLFRQDLEVPGMDDPIIFD